VPFGQARFPERVETPAAHVGQVQACSACATDTSGLASQAAEHAQVGFQVIHLVITEREASAEQGAVKAGARADAHATTVELRAAAGTCGELFLANRIESHCMSQTALVFAGDADGKVWNAANEVGGAVQW